jgi:hypothetical protein
VKHAVAHVACVAVAEQDLSGGGAFGLDPPAMKPFPVLGLDREVAKGEPVIGRRLQDRARREVQELVEEDAD